MTGGSAPGGAAVRTGSRRAPAPIRIPVASLLAEPAGSTRSIDLAGLWIPVAEGPRQSSPGEGALRLTRTNRGIYAAGRYGTTIAESCSRCLRDIDLAVEIVVEEEFLPSTNPTTGAPVDREIEPDVARLTDAHELDVGALLADGLSLVEPIAPLCRPDCPGLCPICGAGLAIGPHEHDDDLVDPRLAPLVGLRVDGEAENG